MAFAIPAIQYLLYFVAVMWWSRVTWSVHLWTGAIAIAGAAGWLISYLVVAPGTARGRVLRQDRPGLAEMTRPTGGAGGRRPDRRRDLGDPSVGLPPVATRLISSNTPRWHSSASRSTSLT